jgi:hypothetical protein
MPVITEIARQSTKDEGETWTVAKSIYRWLESECFQPTIYFPVCIKLLNKSPRLKKFF